MKTWITVTIHVVQLGWSAFVIEAVAAQHAVWWMPALAAAFVAIDGGLTLALSKTS